MIGPSHFIVTDFFDVVPGEDEMTNPGRYGKAFSNWVAEQFRARGEVVSKVVPEDFGWCVLLRSERVRIWIGCGNREGSTTEWGAYIVAEPSLLQRLLKRVDVKPEVDRLSRLLEQVILSVPGGSGHAVEQS